MKVKFALALLEGLEITALEMIDEVLTITANSTQATREHSHYTRKLADLPCSGQSE